MSALLDFVNTREWTRETVLDFHKKHGLFHTIGGRKRGYEGWCKTKHADLIFLLDQVACFEEMAPESKFFIKPTDARFHELFGFLKQSQLEYRDFLDSCMRGVLDIAFINARMTTACEVKFNPGNDPWNPDAEMFADMPTLEAFIDHHCIIFPIWRKEGAAFSRTTRCAHCGSYFFAKSRKAEFCSDECRRDNHRGAAPRRGQLMIGL